MEVNDEIKEGLNKQQTVYLKSVYKNGKIAKKVTESGGFAFDYISDDEFSLTEKISKQGKVIILGAGHIALPLYELSLMLGYKPLIFDDRPSFANSARFPKGEVIMDEFTNLKNKITLTPQDIVIIVTRGHKHDEDVLRWVLDYDFMPAYLGMIGSKKRVEIVKDNLEKDGFEREKIDKLYSPIGLKINSITPAEIAIAIFAEIISVLREGTDKKIEEFDGDVLAELLKEKPDYKMLITILKAEGSTPRTVGAKMLLTEFGKTLGSIGGGCTEGEVITEAITMYKKNIPYKLFHLDLSGNNAEEDGMVCGGNMLVLIEKL
jgi:xanthine dehydrogenase accessory factor